MAYLLCRYQLSEVSDPQILSKTSLYRSALSRLRSSLLARNSSCSAFALLINSKYRPRRNAAATKQANAGLAMSAMIVSMIAPQTGSEPDANIDQMIAHKPALMYVKAWSLMLLFIRPAIPAAAV
jgi:hypothetical protein